MESPHSDFDSMTLLHDIHDITSQAAAGTRSSHLSVNKEDANEYRSTTTSYDDDEYSCGSMSTSTSLTSLSSSSSEGLPSRPSSSQGWNFDGAWSVGEFNHTPKPRSPAAPDVYVNDTYGDPAESGLTESPFLVAQYVARQLRLGLDEDFTPWSPDPQTPVQTPRLATPQLVSPPARQYTNLIRALNLQSPFISDLYPNTPRTPYFQAMASPLPLPLPTIMITAPSSEQPTPMIGNYVASDDIDLLMLQHSLRPRPSIERRTKPQLQWEREVDDDDDDDLALSQVKKTLQATRLPKVGLKGRVVGFFGMRK